MTLERRVVTQVINKCTTRTA